MPSRKSAENSATMSTVTSPTGSKIPVAIGRHATSPGDHGVEGYALQNSKIPKFGTPVSSIPRANGQAGNSSKKPAQRRESLPELHVSPSKIPMSSGRLNSAGNAEHLIRLSEDPVVLRSSPPKRVDRQQRPQSIDMEDEYNHKIERQRQQATRKFSSPQTHAQSPSRIPVATDYSEMKRSGSKSSVGSNSTSSRKYSAPQLTSSSTTSTPNSSRGTSPVKSFRNGGSTEHLLRKSNGSLNSEHCTESPKNAVSKIPLPQGKLRQSPPKSPQRSPLKSIPTIGWSLAADRQERISSPASSRRDQAFKFNSNGKEECESSHLEGGNREGGDPEYQTSDKKRKTFEAYVMTGDRMINLAKTPANKDFRSKHYRPNLDQMPLLNDETVSVPSSPSTSENPSMSDGKEDDQYGADVVVKLRAKPIERRSVVRTSKSEDQLMLLEQSSPEIEECSGSVHTLLDTSPIESKLENFPINVTTNSSTSSNSSHSVSGSSSRVQNYSSTPKRSSETISSSDESAKRLLHSDKRPTSPDVSTSSLISASEHYNGESLLDNISPETSCSPETPEWSLMDSYHKKNNGTLSGDLMTSVHEGFDDFEEEEREQPTNKTVITIGKSPEGKSPERGGSFMLAAPPPPPSTEYQALFTSETLLEEEVNPMVVLSSPSRGSNETSSITSGEESDLESLPSYRPPAKVIDIPSAVRLAKRLYLLDGFKKSDVSRHLSRNNDFNQAVAEEYLKFFDFDNLTLDAALKKFVSKFMLTGETQERERVLIHFSKRYLECNPEVAEGGAFKSQDSVHTLTCAIMLLNTDLHGDNHLQRKMTCNEFIENLSELNDGIDFPPDLLKNIYYAIKHEPIPWSNETYVELMNPTEAVGQPNIAPSFSSSLPSTKSFTPTQETHVWRAEPEPEPVKTTNFSVGKAGGGINPFLTLPDPQSACDYKKGYVMRKCCYDPNGKKTKMGKRGWRMYFLALRDMVLYCFKDEKSLRMPGAYEDINCAIRVHHGLAEIASDYTKKQYVFRLHTADQAQYLFQTSDEKELITWIDAINYVVAMLSSPQLPAPCSSNAGRFQRPLMPSSKSSLSLQDQLVRHERQLLQLRCQIEERLQNPPSKTAKANHVQTYKAEQEFLRFEINRYETYILTLKTKNALDHQGNSSVGRLK